MSRQKGIEAENRACAFLEQEGFSIVARNFFTRFGEIDIIAQRGEVLHFIEVKSGANFEPIYNINPQKLQKLQKAIGGYILAHNITQAYCLDALIIKNNNFELIENITLC